MSYSRVDSFEKCPFKWKLRYIDKLEAIPDTSPTNALNLGTAMHTGAEEGLDAALRFYKSCVPVYTDDCVHEEMKFRHWIPQLLDLPEGEHEVEIRCEDFVGYIDLLVKNEDGTYDIYDYKYTSENGVARYKESPQLMIYKYYFEKLGMGKVRDLYFVFIPKIQIRQKKDEDLYQFRKRLSEKLENSHLEVWKSCYDVSHIENFFKTWGKIEAAEEYPKNESYLCGWCEYKDYCEKGATFMLLPKNERKEVLINSTPDLWIYAQSYVGKTTFVDQFDDVLFLNTDGNIDAVTSPVIRIRDTMEGRIKKSAWQVFLDVLDELEKQDNDFKIVAVDLIEDLYENCRLHVFNREGIRHESDAGYGKGWDLVRTEFLSNMKRLKNMGYRLVYISKEVQNSVKLRGGAEVSTFRPNVNDKVANVLSGTVGLTVRAYADDKGRWINLLPDEYVYGGGRFDFKVDRVPLDKDAFQKAVIEAQGGRPAKAEPKPEPMPEPVIMGVTETPEMMGMPEPETEAPAEVTAEATTEATNEEAPRRRTRKKRDAE